MKILKNIGFTRPSQKTTAFLLSAGLLVLLGGCGQAPSGQGPAPGEALEAQVVAVEPSRLPVYGTFPGSVVSADRVEVASRLSGYVHDLDVHEGQSVKKNQLLFAVDPTGVKSEIRGARAQLDKAQAALTDAETNYRRYKQLYQEHSATRKQYEEIEREWKIAQGNYKVAQAGLVNARAQLKYAEVRSPLNGLVVAKMVDEGQLVSPGRTLLVLEDPDRLQVQVQVPEQVFTHLALGQKVDIRFEGPDYKTHTVPGSVERLVAAADPVTRTHLVKISLPNKSGANSGEYGLVDIPVGEQEVVIVPPGAVYNRAGLSGVFTVNADNQAQFRMVTPGRQVPQGIVILSGLFPGDRIILSAEGSLNNGVKIRPRTKDHS